MTEPIVQKMSAGMRAGGGERGGYLLVDERLCYEVVRCGHSGDDRTTL